MTAYPEAFRSIGLRRFRSREGGELGPLGRLGRWTAEHVRAVALVWLAAAVLLGAFAPRAEKALSGAGWEVSGSESVQARALVQQRFAGLSSQALTVVVHSQRQTLRDSGFRAAVARVERTLRSSPEVASVVPPRPAASVSSDGHTAIVMAGAKGDPTAMVGAAEVLKGRLKAAGVAGVHVRLTGAPGMWSDFNDANKKAMMRSEFLSWPVTLAILVLAFGSLVAAGLPLMLTVIGLMAAAGSLFVAGQFADVSIWAMNFALMFALALGIDYALFIVHRFRGALFGGSSRSAAEAVAATMDTAGKAVLFSGLTVLVSLSAVLLVPSPAFRSMTLGIMLSVVFVLAATLTLLPAVLAKLGRRVDKLALPWVRSGGISSARSAAWAERLWRRPLPYGLVALALLLVLSYPLLGLRTGMPSIKVVPAGDQSREGAALVQQAFGPGAAATLQIVAPAGERRTVVTAARRDPGIARVLPAQRAHGLTLVQAVPGHDPSSSEVGRTIERLRSTLPAAALVGGAAAENHDLERALTGRLPLVLGAVLALGFLLLLLALQAPLLAALAVASNLLATGAAFGAARLIFQDGHGQGLLGFESQGFLDAWAPVFFFAMIFALAMDYTVFLLASAKEHWDRTGDAHQAAVGGLAQSGRVIFAASGGMVAIFFTFALSGPLPPKEMGVILGLAVLLDAAVVRLLLLPVLLRLGGRAAWWLPPSIGRWLPAVRFGHAAERPRAL